MENTEGKILKRFLTAARPDEFKPFTASERPLAAAGWQCVIPQESGHLAGGGVRADFLPGGCPPPPGQRPGRNQTVPAVNLKSTQGAQELSRSELLLMPARSQGCGHITESDPSHVRLKRDLKAQQLIATWGP